MLTTLAFPNAASSALSTGYYCVVLQSTLPDRLPPLSPVYLSRTDLIAEDQIPWVDGLTILPTTEIDKEERFLVRFGITGDILLDRSELRTEQDSPPNALVTFRFNENVVATASLRCSHGIPF